MRSGKSCPPLVCSCCSLPSARPRTSPIAAPSASGVALDTAARDLGLPPKKLSIADRRRMWVRGPHGQAAQMKDGNVCNTERTAPRSPWAADSYSGSACTDNHIALMYCIYKLSDTYCWQPMPFFSCISPEQEIMSDQWADGVCCDKFPVDVQFSCAAAIVRPELRPILVDHADTDIGKEAGRARWHFTATKHLPLRGVGSLDAGAARAPRSYCG